MHYPGHYIPYRCKSRIKYTLIEENKLISYCEEHYELKEPLHKYNMYEGNFPLTEDEVRAAEIILT